MDNIEYGLKPQFYTLVQGSQTDSRSLHGHIQFHQVFMVKTLTQEHDIENIVELH